MFTVYAPVVSVSSRATFLLQTRCYVYLHIHTLYRHPFATELYENISIYGWIKCIPTSKCLLFDKGSIWLMIIVYIMTESECRRILRSFR